MFPEAVREKLSSRALKTIGWSLNTLARMSQPTAGKWALRLFTRPRARITGIHDPEVLRTARQSRYNLRSYDLDINVFHWEGSGPLVLLAHGWESNSSRWWPIIRALRELDFRIISIDAPAHGLSGGKEFNVVMYAAVLREMFEQYQPEVFIGHSAGGMAGVYLLFQEHNLPLQQMVLLAVPYELEQLMDTFRQIVGMNDLVFDGLKDAFANYFGFPMSTFSIHKFVRDLRVPGLIVHDQADTIAPYSGGLAIHQNWPGSRLVSTYGLGHSLPGTEVVDAVVSYLQECRAAS